MKTNTKSGFATLAALGILALVGIAAYFVAKPVHDAVNSVAHITHAATAAATQAEGSIVSHQEFYKNGVGIYASVHDIVFVAAVISCILGLILALGKLIGNWKVKYATAGIFFAAGGITLSLIATVYVLGYKLLIIPAALALIGAIHWAHDHKTTVKEAESHAAAFSRVALADLKIAAKFTWTVISSTARLLYGWIVARFFTKKTNPVAPVASPAPTAPTTTTTPNV